MRARLLGAGKDIVASVWRDSDLTPSNTERFKMSIDPRSKLAVVVALYLGPPERAIVFTLDEKTQVQAIDRTRPNLPMTHGHGKTITHDSKRNKTTDLFAAMHVATDEVLYDCKQGNGPSTCCATSTSSTSMCRVTSRSTPCSTTSPPTRHRRSLAGLPIRNTPGGTCTSLRRLLRGATSSNAPSEVSMTCGSAAAPSPR
jgi:hypothetical protein